MSKFRVALSGDFRKADGSPTFTDFDLEPLRTAADVDMVWLDNANPLRPEQLEDFDALILLAHRFAPESTPKNGKLSVIARFGVGYDTVDIPTCTANNIALCITPDGVRRPAPAVGVILITRGKVGLCFNNWAPGNSLDSAV